MGMAMRDVRHGYLLRVASTHPQHIGQREVVKREHAPVGHGGIGREVEAMAHRSAKLNAPLTNIQAL
jgi:hypothetical protein